MKILFIGDIMGRPGRESLPGFLKQLDGGYDFIVANGENLAGGRGISRQTVEEVFAAGVDLLTTGNHVWDRKSYREIIDHPCVARPANYPPGLPGKGVAFKEKNGKSLAAVSLLGRVYMPHVDCPFRKLDDILPEVGKTAQHIVVDFHAEITAEKQALGYYIDGRASAFIGTHTHTMTADARVLPGGTAYITDCGMVGARASVIGCEIEGSVKRFITAMPLPLSVAAGEMVFNACTIELDDRTGRATAITPVLLSA